jgi:hypothetical protein
VKHIGLTRQEIEHLQNLIARLDAQDSGPEKDRRVNPRIDFTQPMWLNLPCEPGQPWIHVYSRNLSTGGLSFLTRGIFYADQQVVIAHALNELTPMLVLCRVCYCRTIDLGVQEVGLAFVTARADTNHQREIPAEWRTRILESDPLARRKNPAVMDA